MPFEIPLNTSWKPIGYALLQPAPFRGLSYESLLIRPSWGRVCANSQKVILESEVQPSMLETEINIYMRKKKILSQFWAAKCICTATHRSHKHFLMDLVDFNLLTQSQSWVKILTLWFIGSNVCEERTWLFLCRRLCHWLTDTSLRKLT